MLQDVSIALLDRRNGAANPDINSVISRNGFAIEPLCSNPVINDRPSFLGKRVRFHSTLNKVNGLCSTNQRFVRLIFDQFRL